MARKPKLPTGMWERNGVYYARFRGGGRLIRKRLSSQLDAAKQLLNDLKARADKGDFGIVDNDYSWTDLRKEFLRSASQSLRKPDQYRADLDEFERYCKVESIRQITHDYVIGFRAWRFEQGVRRRMKDGTIKRTGDVTPRTVNRQVATLSNMLNRGVRSGRIGYNPISDVKPLAHDTPKKKRRSLSLEEVQLLFDHSPARLKPIWRMFMTTGIRKTELVEMRFSDVDYEQRTVTVQAETAKSHKAREIPLDDDLLATIAELERQASDRTPGTGSTESMTQCIQDGFSREHAFVTEKNTPWKNHLLKRFYQVCAKAGIDGAHPGGTVDLHSLRVSFATLALENGARPKAVQKILGHATLDMTMGIYAKVTERNERAAIASLPFASVTAPSHVIPVHDEHTMCTSSSEKKTDDATRDVVTG